MTSDHIDSAGGNPGFADKDDRIFFEDLMRKVRERLHMLPDKPDESPLATLVILWYLAQGVRLAKSQIPETPLPRLTLQERRRLQDLLESRLSGTPLAYLSERQDFMGLILSCSPDAMVPRQETELLVRTARALLDEEHPPERRTVLDLCTGSGNVALAIAYHVPHAEVWGGDLSGAAVQLAQRNSSELGLKNVQFLPSDMGAAFLRPPWEGTVDLITCNPPYISSGRVDTMDPEIRGHEPRMAFDGGAFGVGLLLRLIRQAPRLLKPNGWLAVEIGLGQDTAVRQKLIRSEHFDEVRGAEDENGDTRVLIAQRNGKPVVGDV